MKDKKNLDQGWYWELLQEVQGVALDNIGTWVAIALEFGAGVGGRLSQKKKNEKDEQA